MEYENHGSKYLRYFLGSIFIWLLVVGLVNITVDPFAMFRLVALDGFNAEKTEYGKYVRMAKAHAIRINKPRGIILGSS